MRAEFVGCIALATALAAGCGGDGNGSTGADGGGDPDASVGVPGGGNGGGDGGSGPDASSATCASGAAGAACDAGAPLPLQIPLYTDTPPCAASTLQCIGNCGGDRQCWTSCIGQDPNAQLCARCWRNNFRSCANSNGCQADWEVFACCVNRNCSDVMNQSQLQTCSGSNCNEELETYANCRDCAVTNQTCGNALEACFP